MRHWSARGPLAWLLLPVALVYGLAVALRRALLRAGFLRTQSAGCPVIVVGNVVAGGSGKTPVVMALIDGLRAQGWTPGVISRGHGRRSRAVVVLDDATAPEDGGDEPVLVRRLTGAPVAVAARRIDAARALRAAHPQVDVIVCDDGLQHLALARDVALCVFGAGGIGNGWLLPAGPLREPWPRPVDAVLHDAGVSPPASPEAPAFSVRRTLADMGHDAHGHRVPLVSLRDQRLTAVAGIAHPQAFFDMLRERGLHLDEAIPLPDHYDFDSATFNIHEGHSLICTEKDAVKLWRTHPRAIAVPLDVAIDDRFWPWLAQRLPRR